MDVGIIGAGPAGLISAIAAQKNNLNCTIFEEHGQSGYPQNCSGLFSKSGLESLSGLINYKKFIKNSFNGAVFDFSGEKVLIERNEDVAYSLKRSDFDFELSLIAQKEGARICFNKRISGDLGFKSIIGADGPNSFVADYFNFPKIEKFVSTAQSKIRYFCPDKRKVYLFYSNEIFPGFFGWIIPENEEYAEIGCGAVLPNNAKASIEKFSKKLGVVLGALSHSIIPIRTRKKTAMQLKNKNIILVGDAAGQVKSTTGGGVVFGGNCAKLAGIYANNPLRYEKEWKKKFGLDLKTHSLMQSFLEKQNDGGFVKIGKLINRYDFDSYLSKKGDMDSPSKMLRPDLIFHFLRNLF